MHEVADLGLLRGGHHAFGPLAVHPVEGLPAALLDDRDEVDDGVAAGEGLSELGRIGDVRLDERDPLALGAAGRPTGHDDHLVSGVLERTNGVDADEAGTTGHRNAHAVPPRRGGTFAREFTGRAAARAPGSRAADQRLDHRG